VGCVNIILIVGSFIFYQGSEISFEILDICDEWGGSSYLVLKSFISYVNGWVDDNDEKWFGINALEVTNG